jgi:hypothetical protein
MTHHWRSTQGETIACVPSGWAKEGKMCQCIFGDKWVVLKYEVSMKRKN